MMKSGKQWVKARILALARYVLFSWAVYSICPVERFSTGILLGSEFLSLPL